MGLLVIVVGKEHADRLDLHDLKDPKVNPVQEVEVTFP
jgi:hypothetical protein